MAHDPPDQHNLPYAAHASHAIWPDQDGYYPPHQQHMQYAQQNYFYSTPPQQHYAPSAFGQPMGGDISQYRPQYAQMQQMNVPQWPNMHNAPPPESPNSHTSMYGQPPVPRPQEPSPTVSQQQVHTEMPPPEETTPKTRRNSTIGKEKPPPRKTLSENDRRDMCIYHEQHPEEKQEAIGKLFGVERSTVSKVLRKKEMYLADHELKGPIGSVEELELLLTSWCKNRKRASEELTREAVREQAQKFLMVSTSLKPLVNEDSAPWLDSIIKRATVEPPPQPRNRKSSLARKRSKPSVKNDESKTQSPRAVSRGGSRKPSLTSLSSAHNDISPSRDTIQGSSTSVLASPMISPPREAEYRGSGGMFFGGPSFDSRPRSGLTSMIPDDVQMMSGPDLGGVTYNPMEPPGAPTYAVPTPDMHNHTAQNVLSMDSKQEVSPRMAAQGNLDNRRRQPNLKHTPHSSASFKRESPAPMLPSPDEAWHHFSHFMAYLRSPSNRGQVDTEDIEELQQLVYKLLIKRGDRPGGLSSIREGEGFDNSAFGLRQQPQFPRQQTFGATTNNHGQLRRSKTMGGGF